MRLIQAHIAGYRSIREGLTLFVEAGVTVILGANDHGKSNILAALTHLNEDRPFTPDDLNWDLSENGAQFPSVEWEFLLSDDDRGAIARAYVAAVAFPPRSELAEADEDELEDESEEDEDAEDTEGTEGVSNDPETDAPQVSADDIPERIRIQRVGVQRALTLVPIEGFRMAELQDAMFERLPAVELIAAWDKVPDSITAADLNGGSNEFMKGILYYAGISRSEAPALFKQTDATRKRLARASQQLNRTLKESWVQGKDLDFQLEHDSAKQTIELLISDPAVQSRYVRASRRSSGFTHYFAMKTILHAREVETPATSYMWLFDEPGTFLHPAGQHDMIQVMEKLGRSNQVMYVTHSLFMLNKTFPTRHRMLLKDESGTRLDAKPYTGQWSRALKMLGLSPAGTILFASHVLLTEGDTEPLYIPALMQKLAAMGKLDPDLNVFAVMSCGDVRTAEVMIEMFMESRIRPKMGVLVDGDKGGAARVKKLDAVIKKYDIAVKSLSDKTTIEDHLIGIEDLLVPAGAIYAAKLITGAGKPAPDLQDLTNKFRENFLETFESGKVTSGVASWLMTVIQEAAELDDSPSKVGVAREYVALLADLPPERITNKISERALGLASWIQEKLAIPSILDADEGVVER